MEQLVSQALCGSGATLEEAAAKLDEVCVAYLRSRGRLPADVALVGAAPRSATVTTAVPAAALESTELERHLMRFHWPVDSWRSDLRLWVSHWRPMSRKITKFIVSDYPRTSAWDLVESTFEMEGPRIGGFMSSPSHALNRLFPDERRETLVGRSYQERRYVIHPLVVQALQEALNEPSPDVDE